MALGFFDESGHPLRLISHVWKLPPGVAIGWGAFKVHRIGIARVRREGVDPIRQLTFFHDACKCLRSRGCRVVAHNAAFDHRMLAQTARRHAVPWALTIDDYFCTMQRSRDMTNLRGPSGRRKAPSNVELYQHLMHHEPNAQLHDALEDIKVTACSFVAGAKRGWWSMTSAPPAPSPIGASIGTIPAAFTSTVR